MNPYSDLKPAWHTDKIAALRAGEQIVPAQVQLILSDLCNQDCGFCAYRMSGYASNQHFGVVRPDGTINQNPARFIPADKAVEILHDCARMGVKAVQFTGGGEPTVHPQHMEVFEIALSLGLQCALVTNGQILRSGWDEILPRFSWIRVSLDAGRAETYAKVRRVHESGFGKALGNIRAMADAGVTYLGVSFIVLKENLAEIEQAAALAKEAGADSIRFGAFFSNEDAGYYTDILPHAKERIEQATIFHDSDRFRVINMLPGRVEDLKQGAPDYAFCGYQQFNCYIGADLNVYRCCDTAYNDRGLTGSLKNQSFLDFWASQAKQTAYESFDARGCTRCAFNGKNRVINQLVDPAPAHVAFV